MRCPKCGSSCIGIERDGYVKILVCRICGFREYGDPADGEKEQQQLLLQKDRLRKKKLAKEFASFIKSRTTTQQAIKINDSVCLCGDYDIHEEAAIRLPDDLKGKSVLVTKAYAGGYCIEAVRRDARRVCGLEIDWPVLREARELLRFLNVFDTAPDYSKVDYKKGVIEDHVGSPFDVVVSIGDLERTLDPKSYMEGLQRAVKPGGMLVLETKTNGTHTFIPGFDKTEDISNGWKPSYRAMLQTLEVYGFHISRVEAGRTPNSTVFQCSIPSKVLSIAAKIRTAISDSKVVRKELKKIRTKRRLKRKWKIAIQKGRAQLDAGA